MALKFEPTLEDFQVQLAAAQNSEERLFSYRFKLPDWQDGILDDLLGAKSEAEAICALPPEVFSRSLTPRPQKLVTQTLHEALHTETVVIDFLAKRLSHWFSEGCQDKAQVVFQCMRTHKKEVPPFALVAYLKTVANAWATTTRHGHEPDVCILGREAKDSLGDHYMACPVLWKCRSHVFLFLKSVLNCKLW